MENPQIAGQAQETLQKTGKNERLLRALRCQPVDMTPVWIMRQAGRYLPEYRALRARAGSFMALCTNPELACEVTLQPLARFPLDAAILFSDILTIPDAMGLGLHFVEGEGPRFSRTVRNARDVAALGVPDPETDLRYVCDTVRLLARELASRVPLIGFCGSPYTIAAYMTEGRSGNGFPAIRAMREAEPQTLHQLLDVLARAVGAHLVAQAHAGADALMIFDTWGGMLETQDYLNFSLFSISAVLQILRESQAAASLPVILFTRGGGQWLEPMIDAGVTAIGLDQGVSLREASGIAAGRVALQGNLDPAILLENPETIRAGVAEVLSAYGKKPGHIFNLGHGITPDVPPEHVAVLVDAVHEMSRA